jgi:hypothetical protein
MTEIGRVADRQQATQLQTMPVATMVLPIAVLGLGFVIAVFRNDASSTR